MQHTIQLLKSKPQNHGSPALAKEVCEHWLTKFASMLQSGDYDGLEGLFVPEAWMRDLLGITWDFRSLNGRDKVIQHVKENSHVGIDNLRLCDSGSFAPRFVQASPELEWIESMFGFETIYGRGRGMIRLVANNPEHNNWRCYIISFILEELKGHEEKLGIHRPSGNIDPTGGNWQERRDAEKDFLGQDPVVLIVGGGQAGLCIAARLRHLNIPALIIERNKRVGDNWRKRYRTLSTHDSVHYCHLPYIPFPTHWPFFTPKDKLADWLEAYSSLMELNVWCDTELQSSSFDESTDSWTVTVKRPDGSVRTLRPKHLVLATGNAGDAIVPKFPNETDYKGVVYHVSQHNDASMHSDLSQKNVVVVGSGNSAHDVCENFHESGARSVTMVQRSSTYVISARRGLDVHNIGTYEQGGPPTNDCDIFAQSNPIPIKFAMNVYDTKAIADIDREILDGLVKAGFRIDYGEAGSGIWRKYVTRSGGYYINVGCSELIADGKVKIKSSPDGIKSFTPKGLLLADDSEVEADIIVLATGYETMRSTARHILDERFSGRLGQVWDLDSEGELQSMWRYSGHPKFWFMGGNLALCRTFSGLLALQIKASQLGIYRIPERHVAAVPSH